MSEGHDVSNLLRTRASEEADSLIAFLRDIVAIESFSGQEEAVVRRIRQEMEAVGFDEVTFDALGNVLGRIGPAEKPASGRARVIAYDAHVDTVNVGDRDQWDMDPFAGKLEDGKVYGRGSVDQKAGVSRHWNLKRLYSRENPLVLFTLSVQAAMSCMDMPADELGEW